MKKKIVKIICKSKTLKNLLYKITTRRHFVEKYLPIFKEYKKSYNKVFLIYTPVHGNLGDHAIATAERALLDEMGIEYTEITTPEIHEFKRHGLLKLFNNTNVFINGGGNLGTLWFDVETMFRDIITSAPKANILIFPSTIYYENTEYGEKEFENSKRIYNTHKKLFLYARESVSYEIMAEAYKNVKLVPDMVLSLNKSQGQAVRSGCVTCLRNDVEKTLTEKQEQIIYAQIKKLFGNNITHTDMNVGHTIPLENRMCELEKKFAQFSQAELVVTDRLHSMIFCAITGTPCIVVNSKSPKVKGCYKWIENLEYIKFADSIEDIENKYNEIPKKDFVYDNSHLKPHFDSLKDDIKSLLN